MNMLLSILSGYRLVIGWALLSAACLAGAYVTGRSHANTAWEGRWAKQTEAARADAAKQEIIWESRIEALETERDEAMGLAAARTAVLVDYARSVQELAARPRAVPSAATPADFARELAAEQYRSSRLAGLLGVCLERGAGIAENSVEFWSAAQVGAKGWPKPINPRQSHLRQSAE